MYILYESTYTDKESVSLYTNYTTENDLLADFETKLGQAMKAEAYKGEVLIAFDHTGRIYATGSDFKDEETTFSPRLIWVESTAEGESQPNQSKKTDLKTLEADYHVKKGSAMKNADIRGILLIGLDGTSVVINDYVVNPVPEVVPEVEEIEEVE